MDAVVGLVHLLLVVVGRDLAHEILSALPFGCFWLWRSAMLRLVEVVSGFMEVWSLCGDVLSLIQLWVSQMLV